MIETELKIALDAATMARLKRHPALPELRIAPRRTEKLVSVYYDTADHALARAAVSLRLRRVGRGWVQTIKRPAGAGPASGLFSNRETECPAPGGRLMLEGADPDGALADVARAAGDAPLAPVFETRVQRVIERLKVPGGEIELALDQGEIVAGETSAPIREAELELKGGEVGALYGLARRLFTRGPVEFAASNKAARGYRLARTGSIGDEFEPRNARTIPVAGTATVEAVARDVLRDCLAQVAANMVVVAGSEAMEGPHQLRVGLRRLRTAFALFGPSLGAASLAPLNQAAKRLGQVVGGLRDIDVLIGEVVAEAAKLGLDPVAHQALAAVLGRRREAVRTEVRTALAAPEAVGFLFDLGAFIEGRGWLAPSDYSQTERLAAPIATVAPGILDRHHARVSKRGRRIRELDPEGLHDLRKELKKLRYAVDMLGPIYKAEKVAGFLKSLKELQDAFGSLNDAAMAHEALTGEAVGEDPAAQRATGWVLGTLTVQVRDDRPKFFERWDRFAKEKPFWT